MGYEDLFLYKIQTIESLWLVLTYRCQFRCKWCYTHNGTIQKDMDLNDALNTCNMFSKLGGKNIVLIGGEPLLYKNLSMVVKTCSDLNLNTILITNGFLLKDEEYVSSLKNAGLTGLTMSLHGYAIDFSKKIKDKKKAFQRVQKVLVNLHNNHLLYEISCLIDSKKPDYFLNLISWARGNQIPSLLFLTYVPPVETTTTPKYIPSPKDSAKLIELLYKESLKIPCIKCQFVFQYPFCLFDKNILDSMLNDDVLYGSHEIPFMGRGVALDPLGNFLPSSHWVGFPLFHSDEIRENGYMSPAKFLEKWNSEKALIFRKKLWENLSFASERCQGCKLWPSRCVGGNPLVWQVWDEKDLLPEVV